MADDFLPIAQPAARPEPAAARKTAFASADTNDKSFADILGAEVKAMDAIDKDVGGVEALEATPAVAAPAQSAPPPANTAAFAAVAAALQPVLTPDAQTATSAGPQDSPSASPVVAPPAQDASAIIAAALAAAASAAGAAATSSSQAAPVAPQKSGKVLDAGGANAPEDGDAASAVPAAGSNAAAEAAVPVAAFLGDAAAAAKPAAPVPEAGPGARRAESGDAQAPAVQSTDSAKPAHAAASASSAQGPNPAAQAGAQAPVADASAGPDLRMDAAAPSSNASTSATASLTPQSHTGQAADAARAQNPALANAPTAAIQVYTRMIERMDGRAQRFEVRLDPAELGRVDVRIEVGADRKVHAVLAAHDSAALTDLMKGQKALEQALSDAGIDLADGGIQFEMSKDSGQGLTGNDQRQEGWSSPDQLDVWRGFSTVDVGVEAGPDDLTLATRAYSRRTARLDLVA